MNTFKVVQRHSQKSRAFWLAVVVVVFGVPFSAFGQAPTQKLRVSSNNRFLVKEDGSPFFLLADSAWFLPKVSDQDVSQYMADRAALGFTATMISVKYHKDIIYNGNDPFLNDNTDTPNATFWEHMDFIVDEAAQHNMYVGFTLMWAEDWVRLVNGDTQRAYRLGKYIGQRYSTRNNIYWIVSGEYDDARGVSLAVYDAAAQGLKVGDGGIHLMTMHPGPVQTTSVYYQSSSWLSFNMLQSGHLEDSEAGGYPENYTLVSSDYGRTPTKPVIEGEPCYEELPWISVSCGRRRAYWAVFAGAFGHTFGNEEIEIMWVPGDGNTGFGDPHHYWKESLSSPGATQMIHLRNLMESRSFLNRIPDQSIVTSSLGTGITHITATRASDGNYALVYVPDGREVTVDMSKIAGLGARCSWYDTRTGTFIFIGEYANANTRKFDAPGDTAAGNDWVLVMDSMQTQPPGDIQAPVVSIVAPLGQVPDRQATTISANASDNVGVTQVEFYVNGALLCTDSTAPYSCVWNVPKRPGLKYNLQVKGYDQAGNIGTSSIVTVTSR
jgi:hypothetical protein